MSLTTLNRTDKDGNCRVFIRVVNKMPVLDIYDEKHEKRREHAIAGRMKPFSLILRLIDPAVFKNKRSPI